MDIYDEISSLKDKLKDIPQKKELSITMKLKDYHDIKKRLGGDFKLALNDKNEIYFIKE